LQVSENGILKIIIGTKRYEETGNGGEMKLHNAKTSGQALNVLKLKLKVKGRKAGFIQHCSSLKPIVLLPLM
jgi:hypothetical protein